MGGAIQGGALTLIGPVTTHVGTGLSAGSTDGTGAAARFNGPRGITTDGTNLYVSDTDNHTIRKIVIATGVVTTLAGTAGAFGSIDGTGTAARFNGPYGITTDGIDLYVTDLGNSVIRKVVIATGVVTTFAGTAGANGTADGTGAAARFNFPGAITTDNTNLYIGDTSNHTIRKIVIATGVVTTLAGTAGLFGSTDGAGAAARFNFPNGITTDGTNLYVSELMNGTVRTIGIATGTVTTLAGTALSSGTANGIGAAARFTIPGPSGPTTDGTNLFVSDTSNHTIRKIVIATGVVTRPAGLSTLPGSVDSPIPGLATFNLPRQLTTDGNAVFVADYGNHTIRRIQNIP